MAGKRVTVRLTHNSGVPGSEGMPGQVVECSEEQAASWFAVNGAVEVAAAKPKPVAKPKRKGSDRAAK
tara:strand:- start:4106 stop:4309 length:204 start_codon:yes stop_codon:yes gene_type:complete